ncbi:hypothetical protein [Streptomyces sp. NPDC058739]|uniref:hypothetical protein n=1 Tax=Streptomyces sp. NPDC058739 TaxID=3346618 RepID=UPI0036935DBF
MASGLTADWALWGKVPHTARGYEVVAAHPPGRSGEFNAAIQHWYPGTPSAGDRLPWITIGCDAGGAGGGTVGVFLLDRARITHFAVPYQQVREAGIGWYGMARAAGTAAEHLDETRTGPAELTFGEDDLLVDDVAGHITTGVSETTRWLAAAAAYLLDGPVAVTGADGYQPFGVLRMLDSVAALLPFGVRSTLSAATSTSPGAKVPMRLFWGDPRGAPGVTSLPLSGELPDLGGLSPQARTYHDLLLQNWTQDGGEAVVHHLAEAREPLDIIDLRTPGYVLGVLESRNRELAVRQAHTDLNHVLSTTPRADAEKVSAVLVTRVLPYPDTDLEAVAPHLSEDVVSQVYKSRLVNGLLDGQVEAASASFERMRAARAAAGLDLGPLDQILTGVMDEVLAVGGSGESDPVSEGLLPGIAPFAEGTMALTQSLLRQRPGLASRLIRALYDRPEPAPLVRAWLLWLCGGPNPRRRADFADSAELPVLHAILNTGTGLAEAGRKWAAGQPDAPTLLLEGAAVCGHGDEVLQHPGFFEALAHSVRGSSSAHGTEPGELLVRALRRRPAGLRPESSARWDVLCALKGLPPSGFTAMAAAPPGRSGPESRVAAYAAAFDAELRTKLLRRQATAIVRDLLEAVLAVDSDTGVGPGPAARALTLHILDWSDAYTQPVLHAVHRLATSEPHWDETDQDREWLGRICDRLPALRSTLALRELTLFAAQATDTPEICDALAALARAAGRAGAAKDDLCAALMSWAVRDRDRIGERILAVFNAYQAEWARDVGTDRAAEERAALETTLALTESDHPVLQYYCDHTIRRLTQQGSDMADEIRHLQARKSLLDEEINRMHQLRASAARTRT